ncbi:unnamed protein product [Lampetra fluviatilis]
MNSTPVYASAKEKVSDEILRNLEETPPPARQQHGHFHRHKARNVKGAPSSELRSRAVRRAARHRRGQRGPQSKRSSGRTRERGAPSVHRLGRSLLLGQVLLARELLERAGVSRRSIPDAPSSESTREQQQQQEEAASPPRLARLPCLRVFHAACAARDACTDGGVPRRVGRVLAQRVLDAC